MLADRVPRTARILTGNQRLHIVAMDAVFKALADASRTGVARSATRRQRTDAWTDCALRLAMTRPGGEQTSGHHWRRPILVATVKRGREKLHYLNPVPIHEIAERWIGKFERSRLQALSDMKKH